MTQREQADAPTRRRWLLPVGRIVVAAATVAVLVVSGIGWAIHHRADTAMAAHRVDDALFTDDPNIRPAEPTTSQGAGQEGSAGEARTGGDEGSTGTAVASGTAAGDDGAGDAGDAGGEPVTPEEAAAAPPENILILGLDTRGHGEDGIGPGTSQSDVIMIAHLHAGHRQMSVLSIPRDLYISAPTCKQWDNSTGQISDHDFVSPYSSWKITNAYSVGGPRCTVQAVQALTGLRIDRLITLQFDGFSAIVDALGGLDMTFSAPVIDRNQGTVIPAAGTQHVTGEQALRLVRSRIVEGSSSGDLGRIRYQQRVLSAIMAKMTSTGLLADPARLDRVMQTFAANATTANVDLDQLLALARVFSGGDGVSFSTLPTAPEPGSDGLSGTAEDESIFARLRADEPLG